MVVDDAAAVVVIRVCCGFRFSFCMAVRVPATGANLVPVPEPPESGGVLDEETAENMGLNVKEISFKVVSLRNDVLSEIVFSVLVFSLSPIFTS